MRQGHSPKFPKGPWKDCEEKVDTWVILIQCSPYVNPLLKTLIFIKLANICKTPHVSPFQWIPGSRERIKQLAQGHTASKYWSWNLIPCSLCPITIILPTVWNFFFPHNLRVEHCHSREKTSSHLHGSLFQYPTSSLYIPGTIMRNSSFTPPPLTLRFLLWVWVTHWLKDFPITLGCYLIPIIIPTSNAFLQ